jgi:hypothetical protein
MFAQHLFNPTTGVGFLLMHLNDRRARLAASSDRGASAIEWVVITAVTVALVILIGTAIKGLVDKESAKIVYTGP